MSCHDQPRARARRTCRISSLSARRLRAATARRPSAGSALVARAAGLSGLSGMTEPAESSTPTGCHPNLTATPLSTESDQESTGPRAEAVGLPRARWRRRRVLLVGGVLPFGGLEGGSGQKHEQRLDQALVALGPLLVGGRVLEKALYGGAPDVAHVPGGDPETDALTHDLVLDEMGHDLPRAPVGLGQSPARCGVAQGVEAKLQLQRHELQRQ